MAKAVAYLVQNVPLASPPALLTLPLPSVLNLLEDEDDPA
jgi:hypothetical protein